jgi:predicted nucleic acid-binding protein
MVVVDSDVIIWILRGNRQIADRFKSALIENDGSVFVTPVQLAEVFAGTLPKERAVVDDFFGSLEVLAINETAGRLAGEFLNRFRKSHNVTLADAMVAAVSRVNGCELWTRNKKHYPMFKEDNFYRE